MVKSMESMESSHFEMKHRWKICGLTCLTMVCGRRVKGCFFGCEWKIMEDHWIGFSGKIETGVSPMISHISWENLDGFRFGFSLNQSIDLEFEAADFSVENT